MIAILGIGAPFPLMRPTADRQSLPRVIPGWLAPAYATAAWNTGEQVTKSSKVVESRPLSRQKLSDLPDFHRRMTSVCVQSSSLLLRRVRE
jgi:hypothetical protein